MLPSVTCWTGGWRDGLPRYPQVPVQRVVQRDLQAHALVELSRSSVSHTLLHRAQCPVAVVRGSRAEA